MQKKDLDQLIDISDLYYDLDEFRKRERNELLYKDGYEFGKQEGKQEGEQEGKQNQIIASMKVMSEDGFSFEDIAKYLLISPDEVKQLLEEDKGKS